MIQIKKYFYHFDLLSFDPLSFDPVSFDLFVGESNVFYGMMIYI